MMNNEPFIVHGLSFIVITVEHERLMRMKKISLRIFSALMLFHLVFIPARFCVTGQEVLNEIQNRYEKTNDIEANFIQEYIGKVMKQPNRGEGKVYFKKKGMMRWDYTVPNQKLISNGHTLWYYQPDEKQVFVSDVSRVLKEKTPLAFLAGEGNLSRDFKLLNLNESVSQKEENFVVELAPKEPLATLSKLILTVDKKTYYCPSGRCLRWVGKCDTNPFHRYQNQCGALQLPLPIYHPTRNRSDEDAGTVCSSIGRKGSFQIDFFKSRERIDTVKLLDSKIFESSFTLPLLSAKAGIRILEFRIYSVLICLSSRPMPL